MEGRTLVMGDIHGNLTAYKQCMARVKFDYELDTLIQLGDVSDKHAHTVEIVEELFRIQSLIVLRGNHDVWVRDWLLNGKADTNWIENGGFSTIKSYQKHKHSIDIEMHKEFFELFQRDFYIDNSNRVFVHGGYTHPHGPQFEGDPLICTLDRSLWRNTLEAQSSGMQLELLANFNEVYLGHTPTLNWHKTEPMNALNVWNLDTGAGTTGKLTIMDIDTKEYWQSD